MADEEGNARRLHTLVVRVENKAGVLARVAALFARRGFNIDSLAVAPIADDHFSRITIVVDVESAPLDQIIKQLDKLVNVVSIRELSPDELVERELMIITVAAGADAAALAAEHGAVVLAESGHHTMYSITGPTAAIESFEDALLPHGIVELQRTGKVALDRLDLA
ncbi:MAG: acetolactate synthase small subunit [Acidimicrobiia bacterium]|nr:acetolactate synthase small subunit [Acidimicrobiia bacterium]